MQMGSRRSTPIERGKMLAILGKIVLRMAWIKGQHAILVHENLVRQFVFIVFNINAEFTNANQPQSKDTHQTYKDVRSFPESLLLRMAWIVSLHAIIDTKIPMHKS